MPDRILDSIESPCDVKPLDDAQLKQLAAEIRDELVSTVSQTGGHLAPNLGVVELTLGIHRALDCPADRVIFDVGHQSYVHKLITGRLDRFGTLRQYGGLCGFPKRSESPYDAFDTGNDLSTDGLLNTLKDIVPLAITMREQIEAMREWARTRARPAAARGRSPAKKAGWMARHGAASSNLGDKGTETADDGERKLEL